MNVYRKLTDGSWGIMMTERGVTGQTVSVQLRSGLSKNVTLGAFLYSTQYNFVFAIADTSAPRETVAVGDLTGILALFDRAKRHLKFPTITLTVPSIEGGIRISVAGERAKVPGSLTITGQERNAENRRDWYGRILRDGSYTVAMQSPGLVEKLRAFAADPVGVASEEGRLSGNCCFCRRPLLDERSTAVGYGSTCAQNYGLAWGSRPAQFAEGVAA